MTKKYHIALPVSEGERPESYCGTYSNYFKSDKISFKKFAEMYKNGVLNILCKKCIKIARKNNEIVSD